MSKNPASSPAAPEELSDARQKFEAETLTRRAALRKFGITSGMAVFGMFATNDLARMVIKKMEQNEATRQIAETVAHEFKNAGIAFADSSSSLSPQDYGLHCKANVNTYGPADNCADCCKNGCDGDWGAGTAQAINCGTAAQAYCS